MAATPERDCRERFRRMDIPRAANTGGLNFTTTAHDTYFAVSTTPAGNVTIAEAFRVWDDKRIHGGGAYVDLSYSYQQPVTGFAITIGNATGRVILDPAGTLATGTITMPAAPKDGQVCKISSSRVITALTHAPNTGQSLNGALTSVAANGFGEWTYCAANTTWYRTG